MLKKSTNTQQSNEVIFTLQCEGCHYKLIKFSSISFSILMKLHSYIIAIALHMKFYPQQYKTKATCIKLNKSEQHADHEDALKC